MKEELHYGYKKVIYEDGTVKYYNIAGETKNYKEITKKEAAILESKVLARLKAIREKNLEDREDSIERAAKSNNRKKNE
jgi:hypothetical protein